MNEIEEAIDQSIKQLLRNPSESYGGDAWMKTWHEGMTDKETADLAYWERNMLALWLADGWYNDDVEEAEEAEPLDGSFDVPTRLVPRYQGWRRVLSCLNGSMTFHIPDDFDVGHLPEIEPNWDGHTTEEKWRLLMNHVQEKWK